MLALLVAGLLAADASVVVLDVESRVLGTDDRAAVQARVASGVSGASHEDAEVVSTADLRALADVAAEQQSLNCDGSSSCLSELADAYGAATVISIRVNKSGSKLLVEVVALDAHSAKVLKRVDRTTSRTDLLDTAKDLGREVVSDDEAAGVSGLFVSGVVTASVGAAALVGGGVGAVLAEGAVRGSNVSAADKDLGFKTRVPLAIVAVAGAVVGLVGGGLVFVGAE